MNLKNLIWATAVGSVACTDSKTTTTSTKMLRGKKVVHTRTVYHSQDEHQDAVHTYYGPSHEALVDPHHEHHHYIKTRGIDNKVHIVDMDEMYDRWSHHDIPAHSTMGETYHHHHHPNIVLGHHPKQDTQTTNGERQQVHSDHHESHHGFRTDHDLHHDTHEHHFESHIEVERAHEHHRHHHHFSREQNSTNQTETDYDWENDGYIRTLPTGVSSHFNQSLYDELHAAPFRIYAEAMGHHLEKGESFPVFALPQWLDMIGVFTGFSKQATPLIFENKKYLLRWDDILQASTGSSEELKNYMTDNNFRANLVLGKSIGNGANVPFIAMVVSYYQLGTKKNVLVPFSKLEDFFDDTSEKHLLDPETTNLEMAALHKMLEEKRTGESTFYHPALAHTEERKSRLEDMETTHFQKLFQLLIRRSYLFSFGYADCLMNDSHHLRQCLDDTYHQVIKMETTVRGALDEEVLYELSDINQTFRSKVSEACISVQGSGTGIMYGSGSCDNIHDLSAFVGAFASY